MKFKNPLAFKVWSNVFYLPAFILASHYSLWVTAVLVAGVVSFGALYHLTNEKRFFWPDMLCAYALIASNLYLCYVGQFQAPYFWIAFLFVLLAFMYHFYLQNKGQYSLNHGLWHLYGSLITIFCILTLVLQ